MQKTYCFNKNKTEGNIKLKNLLGNKGVSLCELSLLGLPVPPGFIISTEVCKKFIKEDLLQSSETGNEIVERINELEAILGKKFGDYQSIKEPLLLSVRSGAVVSMPGMMDTILNIGLNDQTVITLAKSTGNERFAYDSYRRLISMYAEIVFKMPGYLFEEIIHREITESNLDFDSELSVEQIQDIIIQYKNLIQDHQKRKFPQDVMQQLFCAINCVFKSWFNDRAAKYRKINNIESDLGTAVNVQSMVFGNYGDDSATGVLFSRNPSTGENEVFGEYLINAQGEDIVSGVRTPINVLKKYSNDNSMEALMPVAFNKLLNIAKDLEVHFQDMQDIEFTIERSKLWVLQTRNAKRTAEARIKSYVDMVKENILSMETVIKSIDKKTINGLLHPVLDLNKQGKYLSLITRGLPASPGAACGEIVFSSQDAEIAHKNGKRVILICNETSPEDIGGMHVSEAFVTAKGGMTSHAAVVARGMGKPCICGAGELIVDLKNRSIVCNGVSLKEYDFVTINGSNGNIYVGKCDIKPSCLDNPEFQYILNWVNSHKKLTVKANADTAEDIERAFDFGAEGVGLCRTEHMFFDELKLQTIRKVILSKDTESLQNHLLKMIEVHTKDFVDIFSVIKNHSVAIRLLDPPLHEFLPSINNVSILSSLSKEMNISIMDLKSKILSLHECNPMLGYRGCRIGILKPDIYNAQIDSIAEAGCKVKQELNLDPKIEIMVPFVIHEEEMYRIKENIKKRMSIIESKYDLKLNYKIGCMIELPRAVLNADKIAQYCDFISFGTNDLTQTTLGISRDDADKFLGYYVKNAILTHDPFTTIDKEGVGELLKIAVNKIKSNFPHISIGVCGEHGGDAESVKYFNSIGMDYVSCSPFRVPISMIAAFSS